MLEETKAEIAEMQDIKKQLDKIKPLRERYDELRFNVQQKLVQMDIKSLKTKDAMVSLAERVTWLVSEPQDAIKWLKGNEYPLQDYLVLDAPKMGKLADEVLAKDGEIIPGLAKQTTNYVSVKKVSK